MIRPLAPLIRLFFSDLIASLQAAEPGADEPWPVMIMLDEFDRLGKMPIVAESIKTLRSFGGNLAIVTQTIPALDEIYGENTRRSLQGGAGVKLYLTPSDQKTIEELSQAVGKTTRRVVTRSRAVGRNPFEGRSVSERTEETALLSEDEARRLSLDEVILVVDAQMPVRARRIKYYEDPKLSALHAAQSGPLPWPDEQQLEVEGRLKDTEAQLTLLARDLSELRRAGGVRVVPVPPVPAPQAAAARRSRLPQRREGLANAPLPTRLELPKGSGKDADLQALKGAVLKTSEILAQHGK